MSRPIGEILLGSARAGTREAIIIAPFIKSHALTRLLTALDDEVRLSVVTRWRVDEIVAGVSDLGVWDLVASRPDSMMALDLDLHAKYYRFDEDAFIGSANLTGAGMGWSPTPNLELLVPHDPIPSFEVEALRRATPLIQAEVDRWSTVIDSLPKPASPHLPAQPEVSNWFPRTRDPANLFIAYTGRHDLMSRAAAADCALDLGYLSPPAGLEEAQFIGVVSTTLLTTPLARDLQQFLMDRRRFGEGRAWIEQWRGTPSAQAQRDWQVVVRWLRYFLPQQVEYSRPRHTESIQWREETTDGK